MDILRDILLISHFFGLALIIGPFVGRLRADGGYMFGVVFSGALIQFVSGLALTGLAEMRLADVDNMSVDHTKIAVKTIIGLIILVVAFLGYRAQRKMDASAPQRKLLPLLHTAGALAIINIAVAVIWDGVVRS
jgi:type II secretory pathway predicted ATPase ExeA